MRKLTLVVLAHLCALTITAQVAHDYIGVTLYSTSPTSPAWKMYDGTLSRYGPHETKIYVPGPVVTFIKPFVDLINQFDSKKFTQNMTGELFGILKRDTGYIIETKACPGTEFRSPTDTTRFFIQRLGQGGRTSYLFKFYCNNAQFIKRAKILDKYTGMSMEFVPSMNDTLAYQFSVNPTDLPGTNSKREDRFELIVSNFDGFVPQSLIPTVTVQPDRGRSMRVYPNPARSGEEITVTFGKHYDRALIELVAVNGTTIARKSATGKMGLIQVPSATVPGIYFITVRMPRGELIGPAQRVLIKRQE